MVSEIDPGDFLAYHEPTLVPLLTLISFLVFLSAVEWASDRVFKAGLIGQIAVGIIYGVPLGQLLSVEWQNTFVSLGYLGLVLIIFEGGLTVRIDLLKQNFWLSLMAANIGVLTPIALCFPILYAGFGYTAMETFICGAALSTTSLGTTFVTIGTAARGMDFSHTKVGTILISAAILDDVSGLVMASVTSKLGAFATGEDINIAWTIGRPIVASLCMAVLSPLLCTLLFSPLFRRYLEHHLPRFAHASNMALMVPVLCAYIAIASLAGASVLFGAFLAGTFLTSLPSTHPDGPFVETQHVDDAQGSSSVTPSRAPRFSNTFERYLGGPQKYILQPLFFASMGFAIPFKQLWTGRAVWRGIVFTLAMLVGKMAVGLFIPCWDACTRRPRLGLASLVRITIKPALLLGMAMVPRGEIGLLIIQIGFNQTPFLSEDAFITAAWAIVLNTLIGPATLGLLLRWYGQEASADERWGLQGRPAVGHANLSEAGWWKRWTSRQYSRAGPSAAVSRRDSNGATNADVEQSAQGDQRQEQEKNAPVSQPETATASPGTPGNGQ